MKGLLIISLLLFSLQTLSSDEGVIPIKNMIPSNHNFTKQEVVWMYTMKTKFWDDGTRITVFYFDNNSSLHRRFCSNILSMSPGDFDNIVASKINTGSANSYRKVRSEEEMYSRVELIPGAIGYVSENTLIINGGRYVKKITISE